MYLTVIIIVVGSIGGTIYLWVTWYLKKQKVAELEGNDDRDIQEDAHLVNLRPQVKRFLIIAIVATIVTVSSKARLERKVKTSKAQLEC